LLYTHHIHIKYPSNIYHITIKYPSHNHDLYPHHLTHPAQPQEEIPKSDEEIRVTAAGSVSVRAPGPWRTDGAMNVGRFFSGKIGHMMYLDVVKLGI
jgi:hypothetical protein